jgi:hypothetical protein
MLLGIDFLLGILYARVIYYLNIRIILSGKIYVICNLLTYKDSYIIRG